MLAMTVMVRDEADIIGPMIEHSLAQGIDKLIVTDNGSIDGTLEIIESFAGRDDRIDLRHDPVHRKQQRETVTAMARDAATMYGADWVINADADEFWFPIKGGRTLGQVFAEMPKSLRTFKVDVWDMTGAPAREGTGLQRLIYRDLRPVDVIKAVGLHAHATQDAVHVGDPDVEVAQGNHWVNFTGTGAPPRGLGVEVLHLPWRSWAQFGRKVENAGRAYENNPTLKPSPNHHGMRDYGRLKNGSLLSAYVTRHPDDNEIAAGVENGTLIRDTRLADSLVNPVADELFDAELLLWNRQLGRVIIELESRVTLSTRASTIKMTELENEVTRLRVELGQVRDLLDAQRNRRVVRIADGLRRGVRRSDPAS